MEIVRLDHKNLGRIVPKMVAELDNGKAIVSPTDTVYGLIADATNQEAVDRVFQIKKREKEKPIYIFVKDIAMAKEYAEISQEEEFLKKNWPGKITAVLWGKHMLPEGIESKDGKIGLRIPDYKLIQHILHAFGKPVTGTSANISGMPSCSDSKEVLAQFEGKEFQPDIVVDAGKLPASTPSRVIDITQTPYQVLRT